MRVDPDHFWAQLKYAELNYRLRALLKAERETLKAVDLAANPWELSVARKQLQEIRKAQSREHAELRVVADRSCARRWSSRPFRWRSSLLAFWR